MREIMKGLLVALLTCTALSAHKTYINSPHAYHSLAMNWMTTNVTDDEPESFFSTVTLFGGRSTNSTELSNYFGGPIVVDRTAENPATHTLLSSEIEHLESAGKVSTAMGGKLRLAPVRTTYGAQLAGYVSLDTIKPGLSFHASLPFVEVSRNCNILLDRPQPSTNLKKPYQNITDFFAGNIRQSSGKTHQEGLKFMQIPGTAVSSRGFGDLKARLSYVVKEKESFIVSAAALLTLPLSNSAEGKTLFEPIRGNGGHLSWGVSVTGSGHIWHDKNEKTFVDLTAMLDYNYSMSAVEKRTLGIWNKLAPAGTEGMRWGSVKLGVENKTLGTFPLANVMTRSVRVTPGSQVEAMLGVTIAREKFSGAIAYSIHGRQGEHISLVHPWTDDLYGFAHPYYDATTTATKFDGATDAAAVGGPIQTKGVLKTAITDSTAVQYYADPDGCATPRQVIHTLALNGSYTLLYKDLPAMTLSLGGSYSPAFESSNAVTGWALWANINVVI